MGMWWKFPEACAAEEVLRRCSVAGRRHSSRLAGWFPPPHTQPVTRLEVSDILEEGVGDGSSFDVLSEGFPPGDQDLAAVAPSGF